MLSTDVRRYNDPPLGCFVAAGATLLLPICAVTSLLKRFAAALASLPHITLPSSSPCQAHICPHLAGFSGWDLSATASSKIDKITRLTCRIPDKCMLRQWTVPTTAVLWSWHAPTTLFPQHSHRQNRGPREPSDLPRDSQQDSTGSRSTPPDSSCHLPGIGQPGLHEFLRTPCRP